MLFVLSLSKKSDICGAVLEALSCEAYNVTLPAYIEITLQNKYSRDDDAAQMIQLIIDARALPRRRYKHRNHGSAF